MSQLYSFSYNLQRRLSLYAEIYILADVGRIVKFVDIPKSIQNPFQKPLNTQITFKRVIKNNTIRRMLN